MWYKILADCVTGIHLGYVAFVVVAQLLILIGWLAGWGWVRNFRFRVIHLIMVEVVALEGFFGILCPLTTWEDYLRAWSRGEAYAPPPISAPAPAARPLSPPQQPARVDEPAGPVSAPASSTPEDAPPSQQGALPVTAAPNADPAPPRMPAADPPTPATPPDPAFEDSTFVGRLLGSILYVSVDQAVLDRWYVGFGVMTLVLFLVVPPRLARATLWPASVVCLWIGPLLMAAAYYDLRVMRQTVESFWGHQSYQALAFGLGLVFVGLGCTWLCRKSCSAPGPVDSSKPASA